MKYRLLSIFLLFLKFSTTAQISAVESKIEHLISAMTLEEKVGQMTQLTLSMVCKGAAFDDNKILEIDTAKLRNVLLKHHVGSILNTSTHDLSREKWYEVIGQIQKTAKEESRLKIPVLYGVDAIHGATFTSGSNSISHKPRSFDLYARSSSILSCSDNSNSRKSSSVTS